MPKNNMKDKKMIMKKACHDGKGGCKGKGGLMGDTIKEIPNTISRGIKGIRNIGGKVVDSYLQGFKNVDDANMERNKKMIEGNWGSVKNYEKLQKKEREIKSMPKMKSDSRKEIMKKNLSKHLLGMMSNQK